MAKSKEGREEEFHLAIIRHQKKELRKLEQKIKLLEKSLGYSQNKSEKTKSKIEQDDNLCSSCGKGIVKEMEIAGRVFEICQLCHNRSKKK